MNNNEEVTSQMKADFRNYSYTLYRDDSLYFDKRGIRVIVMGYDRKYGLVLKKGEKYTEKHFQCFEYVKGLLVDYCKKQLLIKQPNLNDVDRIDVGGLERYAKLVNQYQKLCKLDTRKM